MSVWFDRFLKTWASTGVVTDPSDAQANAGFAFLGAAPPTVELFNALEQYSDKKDTYLYNQIAGVIAWGGLTPVETNPNTLRDAIIGKQRQVLAANATYYVDIAGNDTTGNGTNATPWRTLQFAYNYVINKIDAAGYTVNIQLKTAGTYAPVSMTWPIRGQLCITGDKLNPRNYIIKNTSGQAVYCSQGVTLLLQGVSVEATGTAGQYTNNGFGIAAITGAIIYIDAVAFGVCSQGQIFAGSNGLIYPGNGTSTANIIYGASPFFIQASIAGSVTLAQTTLTFTGVPNYSTSFINSGNLGYVDFSSPIISGSCTGTKYNVFLNGILITNNAGATVPGSIAGTVASGGQLL